MKSLKRTYFICLVAASLPLLQNCGKARYTQIPGQVSRTFEHPVAPAQEPMGPMDVRHVPRTPTPTRPTVPTPPPNTSGEEPVPPAEPEVRVVDVPEEPPSERHDSSWMDPTYYPNARTVKPVQVPRLPAPPPLPVPPTVAQVPEPCLDCFEGKYKQPETSVTNKLDILFVIDTSNSIFKEREQAALGIERFVTQLPSGIDIHIGVVAAHSPATGLDGELVRVASEPAVLMSSQMGMTEIRDALHTKLTKVKGDRASDGGELGLYSLDRAITGEKFKRNVNAGMFRRDAGLAVVFMSDENDVCSLGSYPPGVKPKPDVNRNPNSGLTWEQDAFKNYCKGKVDARSVYNKLLKVKAGKGDGADAASGDGVTKPLLVSAIVYTETPDAAAEAAAKARGDQWEVENEKGYGYLDMVEMNNGIAVDIGSGDIPAGLASIGQAARAKLALKTEFMIHEKGLVDPNTICVLVDDQEVPFSYAHQSKTVNLESGGRPGSAVEIRWCADKKSRTSRESEARASGAARYRDVDIDPRCVSVKRRLEQMRGE